MQEGRTQASVASSWKGGGRFALHRWQTTYSASLILIMIAAPSFVNVLVRLASGEQLGEFQQGGGIEQRRGAA
jgi:hypothetical protein